MTGRRGIIRVFQLAALCGVVSQVAWLADSSAEDARVLPRGRSRFSVIYGETAGISQTFNGDGKAENITAPYNIDLSSGNLRTFDSNLSKLIDLLNSTNLRYDVQNRSNGFHGLTASGDKPLLGDALSRGFLGVDALGERKQYNVSFFHGLTDKISVGFMIPYVKMQVNTANGITGVNSASDIYQIFASAYPDKLGDLQAIPGALDFIQRTDTETLQGLLTSKGYSRFQDYSDSGIGDVVLGSRYNYFTGKSKLGEWINSMEFGVTLPTGKLRHPRDIIAVNFGDGALALSGSHILNYVPNRWVTLSHSVHYGHRFPHKRLMRVRESPADFIPDESTEELVTTSLGDKLWTTLGTKFNITRALTLNTEYEFYWRFQDKFQGGRPKDYTYLSDATDSYTETFSLSASMSSIPAFLDFKFPLPGEISASYYLPTRGRNSIIAPYGTLELALYF